MFIEILRHLLFVASITCAAPDARPHQPDDADRFIVLTNVHVIPMDSERIQKNMDIVVNGRNITRIVGAGTVSHPSKAKAIDCQGSYVVPGLADMHVHVKDRANFKRYLASGVNTIRDMHGGWGDTLKWREEIRSGKLVGPTLIAGGPMVGGRGLKTPEEARWMVRNIADRGFDLFKIVQGHEKEVFAALIDEAEKRKLPVAGHLPNYSWPIEDIYQSGIVSHEHLAEICRTQEGIHCLPASANFVSLARMIERSGITISTIIREEAILSSMYKAGDAYFSEDVVAEIVKHTGQEGLDHAHAHLKRYQQKDEAARRLARSNIPRVLELLAELHKAGVNLVIGTDSHHYFVFAGQSLHDEMDYCVQAGLRPYDALRMGTVNAARLSGTLKQTGTISVGKTADLVLVKDNPLDALKTLRNPIGVMARGRWLDRTTLRSFASP